MELAKNQVEKLAKNGVFGLGKFIQVTDGSVDCKGVEYVSQVFFLKVQLENEGKIVNVRVVVKILSDCPLELIHADVQFITEVIMYDNVLRDLGAFELGVVPKKFGGMSGKGRGQDFIALEDLRDKHFKMPEALFLDFNHVAMALQKLGEFHGLSYKIKLSRDDEKKFHSLYNLLPPKKYLDGREFFEGSLLRGFKPLMNENDTILKQAYDALSSQSVPELWANLRKPEEPFAVIVHGDFNKNNMLFKYDDGGNVSDVKFIDWAMSGYSDPAIDISFFLYMNTSVETRAESWDDFLVAYWTGVTSVVENPGFRFDEFLKSFAKRAVFGYFPCSFFLPPMLVPESALPPQAIFRKTPEDLRDWGLNSGGAAATSAVASVVQHLFEKGYLEE